LFSPNSKYLFITNGLDGEVFDLESKEWILRPGGYSFGFTKWNFTAGSDGLISFNARDERLMTYHLGGYSLELQREQGPIEYSNVSTFAHADSISAFVFTSKNENIQLGAAYGDKSLILYGHPARSLTVSQDGQIVAGSFDDGTLRVWSLRNDTWKIIDRAEGIGKPPLDRKFSSGEYWIEFNQNSLRLGRIGSDEQSSKILSSSAFRAGFIDPETLMVILTDGTIEQRRLTDGFEHPEVLGKIAITDINASTDFSRDHRSVVVTENLEPGNLVSLWSLENGVYRKHVLDDVREATNVEFTQDSSEVAVAFKDNTLRIWNIEHGAPSLVDIFTFSQSPQVGSFGPDKRNMLVIVADQPILVRRNILNAQVVFPIPPDKGTRPVSDHGGIWRFWNGWFSDDGKNIIVMDKAVTEDGASYTTPILSGV
jgi:WD40 repeat protein